MIGHEIFKKKEVLPITGIINSTFNIEMYTKMTKIDEMKANPLFWWFFCHFPLFSSCRSFLSYKILFLIVFYLVIMRSEATNEMRSEATNEMRSEATNGG